MDLVPFDASSPSDVLESWHALDVEISLETMPGLEPPAAAESRGEVDSDLAARRRGVLARIGGEAAGALVWQESLLEDLDTTYSWMCVTKPRRRAGVGRALLDAARDLLLAGGRPRMESTVPIGGPAERAALSWGARVTHEELCNALDLTAVDRVSLEHSEARAPAGYVVRRWRAGCPEDIAVAFAAAHTAMDDAPRGDEPHDDASWTVARVRDQEARWRRLGHEWLTAAAMHEASGEVAGYTQLLLTGRPTTAVQEDTGVVRGHRGNGLGMVVKAANLLALMAAAPHVRTVTTWNAASNRHMLAVNDALGFRVNSRWNEISLVL